MKTLLLAGALALACLSSPGCASVASAVPPVANAAVRLSVADDKAYAAALDVYVAALGAYNDWIKTAPPAAVAKAAPIRRQVTSVRKAMSDAYAAGNAANLNLQITALQGVLSNLKAAASAQ